MQVDRVVTENKQRKITRIAYWAAVSSFRVSGLKKNSLEKRQLS